MDRVNTKVLAVLIALAALLWIVPHSGHGTLIEHRDEFEKNVLTFFQAKEK